VLVAAYQSAGFIGEALESLRAQTLQPDEVIVCDDGSTDDLDEALEPYRDMIQLVRKENGGFSSALNAATRVATADFVAILDPDDVYLPERLEAIAELAALRPDLDVVTTDMFLEVDGRRLARHSEFHPFPLDAEGQRLEVLRHCFFGVPAIRRTRLLEIGGFDESLRNAEDWDCWIRLILTGSLVGLVDEPLYCYRLSNTSNSGNPVRNSRANVDVLEKLLQSPLLRPGEESIVEAGIEIHTRRTVLLEARQAILAGDKNARSRSLSVVTGRGQPLASRTKAAVAALAPRLARRVMSYQIARSPSQGIELEHR
jgi:glycosyltransferase involved in cell wall biosynthesis